MQSALQAQVDESAATIAQVTEQLAARDVEIVELTALRNQLTTRVKELEENNVALQEQVEVQASRSSTVPPNPNQLTPSKPSA